jgi:1-deoxy-D-xylulose-5-phosphate reductoisomerase
VRQAERVRGIAILGATGTIGQATADVISRHSDRFRVEVVTANRDAEGLAHMARRLGAKRAIVADPDSLAALREGLAGTAILAEAGADALDAASDGPVDLVMAGIVGIAGLSPTLAALRRGVPVALANKECLVAAGALVQETARRSGATILPVDSEHSAIAQAIGGEGWDAVARITLTASGGPFRRWSREEMAQARPEQAVAHPQWRMGAKISVDSATMMNKGLELIEAAYLFPIDQDAIDVVVHPQSIVHGLVAYRDGSVIAQLGNPDMRSPIAYALGWPSRIAVDVKPLSLIELSRLDFEPPDLQRFPALQLARDALRAGAVATATLNAANEEAVAAFLDGRIGFLDIATIVEECLGEAGAMGHEAPDALDAVLALDADARKVAARYVARRSA